MIKLLGISLLLIGSLFSESHASSPNAVVRIGTDGGYEPFTYVDEKSDLKGFEVDLMKEMCSVLNSECTFIYKDLLFENLLPGLKEGKFDIAHGGMGITEDREKEFDFLLYYKATKYFFGKKNFVIKKIPDDLSGLRIGVESNTKFVTYVQALSKELVDRGLAPIKIVELTDTFAVKEAQLSNAIDLNPAGQGLIEAWQKLPEFAKYHATGPELITGFKGEIFGRGDGFAFRKGDPLLKEFDRAMQTILSNCRYAEIERQYLGFYNGYTPEHCQK